MPSRRDFLTASATLLVSGAALAKPGANEKQEEVTPVEDLMREHGVLRRLLLCYQAGIQRIEAGGDFDPAPYGKAAHLIRTFVEDYHEIDEEKFVFPRFEKAGKMTDLVAILRTQHKAGRVVTTGVVELLHDSAQRRKLAGLMREFITMYEPHSSREDTVLFPAFRGLLSAHEYDAIGEQFEAEERRRFGQDGFEKIVDEVAAIEKAIGIYDLARFTPRV